MRLPNAAHAAEPWRIHEFTRDFRLEDVWALPTPGGAEEFPALVALMISGEPSRSASGAAGALWKIRSKVGAVLGWDKPGSGPGSRVPTLRDRLPADVRNAQWGPHLATSPFRLVYVLDNECALEIANQTVHGILHLGWVPDGSAPGGYRGQMAVLVKPNGLLGVAYMAAIKPFRHVVVYPEIMRNIERAWRTPAGQSARALV